MANGDNSAEKASGGAALSQMAFTELARAGLSLLGFSYPVDTAEQPMAANDTDDQPSGVTASPTAPRASTVKVTMGSSLAPGLLRDYQTLIDAGADKAPHGSPEYQKFYEVATHLARLGTSTK